MKITYIHHSCFSVELEHHILLFDYYKGEIPVFPKEKKLYIFASHFHQDHFNLKIFEMEKRHPDIFYILSKEIRLSDAYLSRNGINPDVKERILKIGKNVTTKQECLDIETLESTDAGVAFVLSAEGKQIYHAGDLNWWHWEGENAQENIRMGERFRQQIDKLSKKHFDAAFLPLDPRQESAYAMGFDYFMRHTDTARAFPMHFWGDYTIIERLCKDPASAPYRDKIIKITNENQVF